MVVRRYYQIWVNRNIDMVKHGTIVKLQVLFVEIPLFKNRTKALEEGDINLQWNYNLIQDIFCSL